MNDNIKFELLEEGMILSLVDENNEETEFEAIATLEIGEDAYIGLQPMVKDPTDAEGLFVVLKCEYDEDGAPTYVTIDSEEEYDRVGDIFLSELDNLYFEED